MRLTILILLGLAYTLNSIVLGWVYPNVSTDYDQYVAFVSTRNILYEFMFGLFFLLVYLLSEKIMKSVACFFFVLTFGSIIDKSLGITWYLKSDVLLIIISFILSGIVYVRERK
jgi:peptidoglycan/LPS O-acetylase OafA/YrhL